MNKPIRVLDIIDGTTVDGPGMRTSIYLAGCRHHCPGCHNPHSWDFAAGRDMTVEQILTHVQANGFNVTFSGGDPIYQAEALLPLARMVHHSGKQIWCYTGFTLDEISYQPYGPTFLELVDVLVDGPFIEALRDTTLHFRGSSNQRIIKLHPEPIDITDTFGIPPIFD